MPDLYAALDLPRDAPPETIRAAYRKAAKRAHPDGGGSPQKFALVRLALDTLSDEARRARYDATGEIDEKPVDNARAQLLEMLAAGLDLALFKLYDNAKPPIHNDMVRLTKDALREMRGKWSGEKREFEKRVIIAKELLGRWTAKGENLMEQLTAHRVRTCESQIAMLTERIVVLDRALTVLDDAAFRFDYVREKSPAEAWITGGMQNVFLANMLGQ
jgi:curved DNA-binding protein CbpA